MLTAIIVAGGSSQRMGFDKTFAPLAGWPLVAHSIAAFEVTHCVRDIIVVGRADRIAEMESMISSCKFSKVTAVIAGGAERQASVTEGLRRVTEGSSYVAVHDAARPLILPGEISRVFAAAQQHGAATLGAPVTDTLKRATADQIVSTSVEREALYAMQTPQIFAREILQDAYASIAADHVTITDEVSAVQRLGRAVVVVPANEHNFKVTFPADLALAELVLQQRSARTTSA